MSAVEASAAAAPQGSPPPKPQGTPFSKRLGGAAFLFAAYFAMCFGIAASGLAQSASRSTAPGLIFFLGACFGLVVIAVDSAAAYPFRELAGKIPFLGKGLYVERKDWNQHTSQWESVPDWGLLTCAMCAGMWAGTILAALGLNVFPVSESAPWAIRDLVGHGLVGSAWCWIAHSILHRLGAYGE